MPTAVAAAFYFVRFFVFDVSLLWAMTVSYANSCEEVTTTRQKEKQEEKTYTVSLFLVKYSTLYFSTSLSHCVFSLSLSRYYYAYRDTSIWLTGSSYQMQSRVPFTRHEKFRIRTGQMSADGKAKSRWRRIVRVHSPRPNKSFKLIKVFIFSADFWR